MNKESSMEGTAIIARERLRQVTSEGWSAEHDDKHRNGELVQIGLADEV